MKKESAWEKFKKSGRVFDYLSYRSKSDLMPSSAIHTDDDTYLGAHHENICKWSNYPRNGLK